LLCCLALVSLSSLAADWPQWRGANRDNVWPQKGLPDRLPDKLTPRWKKPIGGGYGGIAVSAGRVFVMDRLKSPHEVERVVCLGALDLDTGREVWRNLTDPPGYSSPVIVDSGKWRQLVFFTPPAGHRAGAGQRQVALASAVCRHRVRRVDQRRRVCRRGAA